MVSHLARSSRRWAPGASLLVLNLCHRWVEGSDLDYSEFAHYDLGQAVAYMTLQGEAMGLTAEFGVGEHLEATSMTAFGVVPTGHRDQGPRDRRPATDLVWPDEYGGHGRSTSS